MYWPATPSDVAVLDRGRILDILQDRAGHDGRGGVEAQDLLTTDKRLQE